MPNPKRRHSKTRRDKRRTHDRMASPPLSVCQKCGEGKAPHRVCPHCGSYRGRSVIETEGT